MPHLYTLCRGALISLTEKQFFAASFLIVHHTVFYGMYLLLLTIKKFNLFEKYKVQHKPVDKELERKALKHVLTNHFFAQPLLAWFLAYPLLTSCGVSVDGPLPTLQTAGLHILLCILFEDFSFYWLHRGLHHRWIYKYIHKQHHEFKANVSICAEYAHPVEDLSNAFAFLLGPAILGVHCSTFLMWTAIRIGESCDAHTGYALPFLPWNWILSIQGGAERHEYHHSHNIGCYGSYTKFWDWLCGTDKAYYRWKQQQAAKAE